MNRNPKRKRAAGFTLLETISSAGILTLLVMAAFGASEAAMRATGSVATVDAADQRTAEVMTRLRRLLMPASLSMLEAVPSLPPGALPEPMQDAVPYDNIRFRTVTGFQNGGPVYVPAIASNPWKLWFQPSGGNFGSLMFDDGRTTVALIDFVSGATFELQGRRLSITLVTRRPDASGAATCELRLALMVP